jgi:tetratricopeptide (TPR) repeat protein
VETEEKDTSADNPSDDSALTRKKQHGFDALRRMKAAISGDYPAVKRNGKESEKETAKEIDKEVTKEAPNDTAPKELTKEAPKEIAEKEAPKEGAAKEIAKEAPKEAPKEAVIAAPKETAQESVKQPNEEAPASKEVAIPVSDKVNEKPSLAKASAADEPNPFQKLKTTASGEFKPITVPSPETVRMVQEEEIPLVWADKKEFREGAKRHSEEETAKTEADQSAKNEEEVKVEKAEPQVSGKSAIPAAPSRTDLPKLGLPRPGSLGPKGTVGDKKIAPINAKGLPAPSQLSQSTTGPRPTTSGDNKRVDLPKSQKNTAEFKKLEMPEFGFSNGRPVGSRPPSSFDKLKQGWADASVKNTAVESNSKLPASPENKTESSPKSEKVPPKVVPPTREISLENHTLDKHSMKATKHSLAALSNWETKSEMEAVPLNQIKRKVLDRKTQKAVGAAVGIIIIVVGFIYFLSENDKTTAFSSVTTHLKAKRSKEALEAANAAITKYGDKIPQLYALRAEAEEDLGDYSKAVQDYTKALASEPGNFDYLSKRANLYMELKQERSAVADFTTVLQNAKYHTVANLDKRAKAFINLGEFTQADADIQAALKLDPKSTAPKHTLALLQTQQTKYQDSIQICNELLKKNAKDYEALSIRGFNWLKLNQLAKAKADLKKSLSIKETASALERSAMVAKAEKDNNAAAAFLLKALTLNPNDLGLKVQRADSLVSTKRYPEALAEYNDLIALGLGSSMKGLYGKKANLEKELGKNREAVEDYSKAIEQNPDDLSLRAGRAECSDKAGMMSAAIEDYNYLIAHQPCFSLYVKRGVNYSKLKQRRSAEDDFDKALAMNPKCKEVYSARGAMYLADSNYDAARINFTNALKLDPNDAQAKAMIKKYGAMKRSISLAPTSSSSGGSSSGDLVLPDPASITDVQRLLATGEILVKSSHLEDAIRFYAQAVKLAPNNVQARRYLAYAYYAQGQYGAAADQFEALKILGSVSHADEEKYAEAMKMKDQHSSAHSNNQTPAQKPPEEHKEMLQKGALQG